MKKNWENDYEIKPISKTGNDLVITSRREDKDEVLNIRDECQFDIESLGFFWGTMMPKNPKEKKYDKYTQENYDKAIIRLQKRFARTIIKLTNTKKGSEFWNRMIRNAKAHLKRG